MGNRSSHIDHRSCRPQRIRGSQGESAGNGWTEADEIPPGRHASRLGVDTQVRSIECLVGQFERRYLTQLLAAHGGNLSKAARAAGMDRVYIYKLLHKHGIER